MRILVDTNIFLDIFLHRTSLYQESKNAIHKAICTGDVILFSSSSIKNIYYFVWKQTHNKNSAIESIKKILDVSYILEVNYKNIIDALESKMNDFEDAIIDSVALNKKVDYILTRNKKDFINANNKALTPEEFLKLY